MGVERSAPTFSTGPGCSNHPIRPGQLTADRPRRIGVIVSDRLDSVPDSLLHAYEGFRWTLMDQPGIMLLTRKPWKNQGKRTIFREVSITRRGGRAADCTGLENRRRRKASESSNLSPSACAARTYSEEKGCPERGKKGGCWVKCWVNGQFSCFMASCNTSSTFA